MTEGTPTRFFVTGGNMDPQAPSYVVRSADAQLYQGLVERRFCYVLTSRQLGKSSLMVRTVVRLSQEGFRTVVLDLTAGGHQLSLEQWYFGLLSQCGVALDLEDELEQFWLEHGALGPLQRWLQALLQEVLPRPGGPLVVFVDEIDSVRNLSFPTSEFFAGIRSLYNLRASNPAMQELTFCLLGASTPSELIADPNLTPFNIGLRVELTDFTWEEAKALARGLPRGLEENARLLERVYHWTRGHPFLTQQLCQALVEQPELRRTRDLDRLCKELFLTPGARNQSTHLGNIRDRLLGPSRAGESPDPVRVGELLALYRRILVGRPVADQETDMLQAQLRLSGLVVSQAGWLQVRNPIYAQAFDRRWITEHMPDAARRVARRAFWRGVGLAVSLVVVLAVPTILAITQAQKAQQEKQRADELERTRDFARVVAASRLLEGRLGQDGARLERDPALAAAFLQEVSQPARTKDFPERALEVLGMPLPRVRLGGPGSPLVWAGFLGDEAQVLTLSNGMTLRRFDLAGRELETSSLPGGPAQVYKAALSGSGERLLLGRKGKVEVVDGGSLSSLQVLEEGDPLGMVLEDAGRYALVFRSDERLAVWPLGTKKGPLLEEKVGVGMAAFGRDGKSLWMGLKDGTFRWVSLPGGALLEEVEGCPGRPVGLASSPEAGWAAMACEGGQVLLSREGGGRKAAKLAHPEVRADLLVFDPTGKVLLSAGRGGAVVWDLSRPGASTRLEGAGAWVTTAAFSPDGRQLYTGDGEGLLRVHTVGVREVIQAAVAGGGGVRSISLSPDGRQLLALMQDGSVRLWPIGEDGKLLQLEKNEVNGWTPEERLARLREVSPGCVSWLLRMDRLGEDPIPAWTRFEDCEAELGRQLAEEEPRPVESSVDLPEDPAAATPRHDVDGDGYLAKSQGGGDCDDQDASIYPGAEEKGCEGLDRNCDGKACLSTCKRERWQADTDYQLDRDLLDVEGDCFVIDAPNVQLHGGGHRVRSSRRPDLLMVHARPDGSAVLRLLVNVGRGGAVDWKAGWQISLRLQQPQVPGVADLDGDGDLDLLVTDFRDKLNRLQNLWLFENRGGGELGTAPVEAFSDEAMGIDIPVLADFDQDGHLDLLAASNGGLEAYFPGPLLRTGLRPAWRQDLGLYSHAVRLVDLNRDGRVEALVEGQSSGGAGIPYTLHALWNRLSPTGELSLTPELLFRSQVGGRTYALADFNGDRRWDVGVGEQAPGVRGLALYPGQVDGRPASVATQTFPGLFPGQALDVDGDGDTDLVAVRPDDASGWSNQPVLLLNDGRGILSEVRPWEAWPGGFDGLTAVRRAGALVGWLGYWPRPIQRTLSLRGPDGRFGRFARLPLEGELEPALGVTPDLDGDGDTDLLLVMREGPAEDAAWQLLHQELEGDRFVTRWKGRLAPGVGRVLVFPVGDMDGPPWVGVRIRASHVGVSQLRLEGFSTGVEALAADRVSHPSVSGVKVIGADRFGVRFENAAAVSIAGLEATELGGTGVGLFHVRGVQLEASNLCPQNRDQAWARWDGNAASLWCVGVQGTLWGGDNRAWLVNGCAGLDWRPCP